MSAKLKDTYQQVTDTIIAALEAGTRPWSKPWNDQDALAGRFPRPIRANGEPYRGINILLLWLSVATHGFRFGQFMTYKQAQALGGQVRKGETGTLIVKYGTFTKKGDDEAEDQEIPYLKGYTVFNVGQIDGLADDFYAEPAPLPEEQRIAAADAFVVATGARITYGGSRACYIPALDEIRMPPFSAFTDGQSFYGTLFHELAHWGGGKGRLDRSASCDKRTKDYAFEELIAEITACFLSSDLSIAAVVREESASYVAGWLKAMREDRRAIFRAASKAQATADFLHAFQITEAADKAA